MSLKSRGIDCPAAREYTRLDSAMSRTEQFAVGVALVGTALSIILQRDFLAYFVLLLGVAVTCNAYVRDFIWGDDRPNWREIQRMPAEEYKTRLLDKRFERWVKYVSPDYKNIKNLVGGILMITILAGIFISLWSFRNDYEVLGRTEKEVPNFQGSGRHTAIQYVLKHNGRKIYTTCELETVDNIDPNARCGFRPLRTYKCVLGNDRIESTATLPLSDLKCKDSDGHNVYLYVDKQE